MQDRIQRRDFLHMTATGTALYLCGSSVSVFGAPRQRTRLLSPGCRQSKVKVARIYMGTSHGLWPKPNMNFSDEIRVYESEFAKLQDELSDVDFVVDELVTSSEQAAGIKSRLQDVDGILAIHFNIGIRPVLDEILSAGKPTMVFAVPYSGHEWVEFGDLRKQELGAKMECMLTSDYNQLAAAIRPFRAIHHLREARILNLTTRSFTDYANEIHTTFGTDYKQIDLERMIDTYNAVSDSEAASEADRWIQGAVAVLEPPRKEILKSCRLALAFERLLDEEDATVMTVDCYGTMHGPLCQSYAYPCVGFTRLNDMGLGGICESDLQSAMTHILFQGLTGKPGFISDPTVDESKNSIILAHCLGSTRMDGPEKPAAPYKLRTIMERQEGVVPQVSMRTGQKVTQARLIGTDLVLYFTGTIIDVPDIERGCRTKITVRIDGDAEHLWKNWSGGLHRVTCYGDISKELACFCRFKGIKMVNEAV